jgi:hypothetical protein
MTGGALTRTGRRCGGLLNRGLRNCGLRNRGLRYEPWVWFAGLRFCEVVDYGLVVCVLRFCGSVVLRTADSDSVGGLWTGRHCGSLVLWVRGGLDRGLDCGQWFRGQWTGDWNVDRLWYCTMDGTVVLVGLTGTWL